MKSFYILAFILLYASCSIDRSIAPISSSEQEQLTLFQNLPDRHKVRIADAKEAGQKLWLCLTFISKENKEPLRDEEVYFYHTSTAGEYESTDPNDESTARLNGKAVSNEKGNVFVQTILPGDYGSSDDNRHIHTTIENADPEAYDIHFKQYTGLMGKNFVDGSDQHFLADLKMTKDSILVAFVSIEVKNTNRSFDEMQTQRPDCEWCGANEAPADISWETTIAKEDVEGERMILEGTVYEADSTTPAKNVILYAYHTNHEGIYEKKGNESGNGVRHGYLRSWIKTNEKGQYRFQTIKPAPYPSHAEPAHVHFTLLRDDFEEYWIHSSIFKGDPMITEEMLEDQQAKGKFSYILDLQENDEGILVGKRDIVLKK